MKAGFKTVKKHLTLSLSLIGGILIVLFTIVGCSDMPYTGSVLTTDDVDRYISRNGNVYCLQNGVDSSCLTFVPEEREQENIPVIHIYPKKLVYVFYHEGKQIVHAERAIDTTEIVKELTDTGTTDGGDQGTRGVRDDGGNTGGGNNGGNNGGTPPPPPPPQDDEDNNGGNNGGNNGNNNQPVATTLAGVSGNGQSAEINQQLANPLVVRVLDQNNAVLSGITVNFSVSPSGSLSSQSPTTDTNGEASTELTLGNTAGSYTVTASVSGIVQRVTFTVTATNPPAANPPPQQPPPQQPPPQQPPPQQPPPQQSPPSAPGPNRWLVWIYYPKNYIGPRSPDRNANYGFNIEDLSPGAEIASFAQTSNPCEYETDKPCHPDGNVYSTQLEFRTSQESVSFRVKWKGSDSDEMYWKQGENKAADIEVNVGDFDDALRVTPN